MVEGDERRLRTDRRRDFLALLIWYIFSSVYVLIQNYLCLQIPYIQLWHLAILRIQRRNILSCASP